jgi:hypothetical protein
MNTLPARRQDEILNSIHIQIKNICMEVLFRVPCNENCDQAQGTFVCLSFPFSSLIFQAVMKLAVPLLHGGKGAHAVRGRIGLFSLSMLLKFLAIRKVHRHFIQMLLMTDHDTEEKEPDTVPLYIKLSLKFLSSAFYVKISSLPAGYRIKFQKL